MKLKLLTIVLFIVSMISTTCTFPPMPENFEVQNINQSTERPWMTEEKVSLIHEEIDIEPVEYTERIIVNKHTTKERMIYDIINVWIMYLNDANISGKDSRWGVLYLYADTLTDAIIMYQNEDTDIGGRLPKDRSTHILMAMMVTKESGLRADAVGSFPRFEVGLMQCHGKALAGYEPKVVRNNYKLGLLLGVRWFASRLPLCPVYRIPGDEVIWRTADWIKPLSVYAGGHRAISKRTGKCYSFSIARERIALTELYITRIDAAKKARLLL